MRNAVRYRLLAVAALACVCVPAGGCKEDPPPVTPPPPPSAPPAPRAAALTDFARKLVGEWEVYVSRTRGNYHFAPDGSFTLTFHGAGAGVARGRWKLEGRQLVLDSESSTTRLTRAGERESAEVASVSENTLMLHSMHHGEPLEYVLRRPVSFVPGKADNPKVVGTWGYPQSSTVELVLEPDGTAFSQPMSRDRFVGAWSQIGDLLVLRGRVDYNVPTTGPTTAPHPPADGPSYETAAVCSADEESLVLRSASLRELSPGREDPPSVLKRVAGAARGAHASTSPARQR